jgi:hypothetical protein
MSKEENKSGVRQYRKYSKELKRGLHIVSDNKRTLDTRHRSIDQFLTIMDGSAEGRRCESQRDCLTIVGYCLVAQQKDTKSIVVLRL